MAKIEEALGPQYKFRSIGTHQWNAVFYDGQWYDVDATPQERTTISPDTIEYVN